MVMCKMDKMVIPRPPALPNGPLGLKIDTAMGLKPPPLPPPLRPLDFKPQLNKLLKNNNASVRSKASKSSNHSQGFRLVDNQDDTGSVYSIYKQKIDSMFESDSSTNTKNSVQARIEKMFTDVAKDTGVPMTDIGTHSFSIDYLGSVPLQEKVTSLAGLQSPLRELYFAYKRTTKHKKDLTGRLEISNHGLKVQYQGEKGDLEQLNSFPTIAVWSAVKFVIHDSPKKSYAFLPLITDPDNIDKKSLFRSLDENEKKYITSEAHSPLFAVVMRKIGIHKQLECHGFVCQTSEDAIVIAATLYKSLMSHMKAKEKKPKNRNGVTCMSIASSAVNDKSSIPVRPPRQKKRSTTSSIASEGDGLDTSDTQPLLSSSSNKGLKKSTKTKRAPKAPAPKAPSPTRHKLEQDFDAILPYEEPITTLPNSRNSATHNTSENDAINDNTLEQPTIDEFKEIKPKTFSDQINTHMSREQKQITAEIKQVISEGSNRGLKRVQSLRKRSDGSVRKKENTGDILTKVTIPRSGSFLNAGGLTRYKSKVSRNNGQATGGSPLGFSELFNEFRLQEGLHSMDEILGVIIDPDGMSFNDLKPIYKEFLLKLAVTLTKDELYQRSKSIMRRQKKKLIKRSCSMQTKKSHHIIVGSKFRRLKHIFQRNFRIRMSSKYDNKLIPSSNKLDEALPTDSKLPESSISTSSYDTRQFRPKEPQITRKQSNRKKSSEYINRSRRDRTSTSEESDFFSIRRSKNSKSQHSLHNQNRNSSSGYVSCSECSYDSESCTCVSADKCYCSLGHKHFSNKKHKGKCGANPCKLEEKCYCTLDTSLTFCGCDTDSCAESNKCYCQNVSMKKALNNSNTNTILEQLKQRGFLPEINTPTEKHKKLCKKNSNTRSTRSVEYMPNPSETYYEKLKSKSRNSSTRGVGQMIVSDKSRKSYSSDNLALDYELFTITNGNLHNLNRSIYARALSETGQLGMHKQSSIRSFNSSRYGTKNGKTLQSTAISSGTCTEALSVKKSAEIAALFADIKLSQTTDITHLASRTPRNVDMDSIISSRNAYNKLPHHNNINYSKPSKIFNRDITTVNQFTQRMVQNSLYSANNHNHNHNHNRNNMGNKSNLYSARNGLYTIQSQSDESRKSGSSHGSRNKPEREYFELEPQIGHKHSRHRNLSGNLENSLGYLP